MRKYNDPVGFSKLEAYRGCPQKFYFQFVEKLPTRGSPAMERGNKMHENIETYLNGWSADLMPEVASWKEAFDNIKTKMFQAEQAWGFNKQWERLPDWFHKDTWLRAKSDAHYVEGDQLVIIDFKSGKYRVPSPEQIELYAICGGSVYPTVQKVLAEYWFLDTGEVYSQEYTRAQLEALKPKYEQYFAPMFADEVFKPTPSTNCRWCDFSKTKNGPCQY